MNREDLLRVYYFGGGYSPPGAGTKTKTEKVTRWRRMISPGGQDDAGNPISPTYDYMDTKPADDQGWESFEEDRQVLDTSADTTDDAATKAAAEEQAKKEATLLRKRRGRASTILTGGMGAAGEAPLKQQLLTGKKQTLGQ